MSFKPWQLFVMGITFAMLFGLVGSYDYDDALASEKLYCDNVVSNVWPAYDNSIDCVNEDTEKQ